MTLADRDQAAAFICRQPGVLCAKDAHCCSGTCGDDHRYACQGDLTLCRRDCVDVNTDPGHCGDCATVCGSEQICYQGGCCTPDCTDKACGDDGCGGSCGTCLDNFKCTGGVCQTTFPVCGTTTCESDAFACCTSGLDCFEGCCTQGSSLGGPNHDVCCHNASKGTCTSGSECQLGCCLDILIGANHDVCCRSGVNGTCTSGDSCDSGGCYGETNNDGNCP